VRRILRIALVSPARGALALATLISDDGVPELAPTSTTYGVGDRPPTVRFEVAHFSSAWIKIGTAPPPRGASEGGTGGTVKLAAPFSATVGEPFEATAMIEDLLSGYFMEPDGVGNLRLEITEFRGRGSLAATNATPATIADVPAKQVLAWKGSFPYYSSSHQFTCQKPRRATLTYTLAFEADYVYVDYVNRTRRELARGSSTANGQVQERVSCTASGATTSTTTGVDLAKKPVVSAIVVTFERPVTTYAVYAKDPDGSPLEAYWKFGGEPCGTPKIPFERRAPYVRWSHADTPPDSCTHASPDHDVTVSVTVAGDGGEVTCVIQGSAAQRIDNPRCI
jgi:hypothetical protein